MPDWWPAAPADDGALYRWIMFLMVGYLVVAHLIRLCHRRQVFLDTRHLMPQLFDSATFGGSLMLLWGIMDDRVMSAIGSTKPFLVIAGLGGVAYGIYALKPKE